MRRRRRRLLEDLAPGATLIADRAYDTNAIRDLAAERGVWANIPPRSIRKGSFAFSGWVYRQRNLVERFFNRIKQFRGLATRYDRNPRTSSRVFSSLLSASGLQRYESAPQLVEAPELTSSPRAPATTSARSGCARTAGYCAANIRA